MREYTWRLKFLEAHSCRSYLYRLLGDLINGTRRSDLEFVQHHVSQTLVEDDPEIDVGSELFTGNPRVHWLIPVIVVSRS